MFFDNLAVNVIYTKHDIGFVSILVIYSNHPNILNKSPCGDLGIEAGIGIGLGLGLGLELWLGLGLGSELWLGLGRR